ncbi:hypothetical protein T492DRAFT_207767 [Pavlovales sp. CCMP2436]|nr:hypothetical protein T492DRAFT_207767 [Pavlovales sp. CCMP2436]
MPRFAELLIWAVTWRHRSGLIIVDVRRTLVSYLQNVIKRDCMLFAKFYFVALGSFELFRVSDAQLCNNTHFLQNLIKLVFYESKVFGYAMRQRQSLLTHGVYPVLHLCAPLLPAVSLRIVEPVEEGGGRLGRAIRSRNVKHLSLVFCALQW